MRALIWTSIALWMVALFAAALVALAALPAEDAGTRNADLFAAVAPADLDFLAFHRHRHTDFSNALATAAAITVAVRLGGAFILAVRLRWRGRWIWHRRHLLRRRCDRC